MKIMDKFTEKYVYTIGSISIVSLIITIILLVIAICLRFNGNSNCDVIYSISIFPFIVGLSFGIGAIIIKESNN